MLFVQKLLHGSITWNSWDVLGYLLMTYYLTVIRPVLEYGGAVWHHGLTVGQSQQTGLFAEEGPENHPTNCIWYAVWFCVWICCSTTLSARRSELRRRCFHSVKKSNSWFTWSSSPMMTLRNSFLVSMAHIQYYELRLINITLLYTMPWLRINNLTHKNSTLHYIDSLRFEYVCLKDTIMELFLFCGLLFYCVHFIDSVHFLSVYSHFISQPFG